MDASSSLSGLAESAPPNSFTKRTRPFLKRGSPGASLADCLAGTTDQGPGVSPASRTFGFVELAIGQTVEWFLNQQQGDGHWRGPLEGDTILESEYLLIRAWAGQLDDADVVGCGERILREQLPNGGWSIYPGGEVDPSASVKAYLALKILGADPTAERG